MKHFIMTNMNKIKTIIYPSMDNDSVKNRFIRGIIVGMYLAPPLVVYLFPKDYIHDNNMMFLSCMAISIPCMFMFGIIWAYPPLLSPIVAYGAIRSLKIH